MDGETLKCRATAPGLPMVERRLPAMPALPWLVGLRTTFIKTTAVEPLDIMPEFAAFPENVALSRSTTMMYVKWRACQRVPYHIAYCFAACVCASMRTQQCSCLAPGRRQWDPVRQFQEGSLFFGWPAYQSNHWNEIHNHYHSTTQCLNRPWGRIATLSGRDQQWNLGAET